MHILQDPSAFLTNKTKEPASNKSAMIFSISFFESVGTYKAFDRLGQYHPLKEFGVHDL